MSDQRLTNFVIHQLGKNTNRNDIIREICEKGYMSWSQADELVRRIEIEHEHEIAKKQTPLLLTIAVGTLIGGALLSFGGGYYLLIGNISRRNLIAFGIGFLMIIGGLVGTWQAIKPMMRK